MTGYLYQSFLDWRLYIHFLYWHINHFSLMTWVGLYMAGCWSGNGRPLSDFIFYIINFGTPIIDASPLPLMLGIVILALALSCIREKLFGDDYITASLCFMMILANPFFIENLSYRYDSLTMCMSVAISIISSYVAYQYKPINIIISSILTIAFLSLYQAALNTYAIFLLAFIISDVVKKNSISNITKIQHLLSLV